MIILVVDDNAQNLYQLQVLLGAHGHQVISAANGAEALAKARETPPDAIVSDILMPVMDGFTLCREWKKDERLGRIPFVFYTATYTDERDRDFALELGAEEFIVKPEEPDVFLRTILEVIRQSRRRAAMPPPPPPDTPRQVPIEMPEEQETQQLKKYSEVLIRKLEDKMAELEKANRELAQSISDQQRAEKQRAVLEEQFRQAQKMEAVGRLAGGIAHDFNNILTGIGGYAEMVQDRLGPTHPVRDDLQEIIRLTHRAVDLTRQLLAFSRRQPLDPHVLNINSMISDSGKMLKRVLGEDIDLQFTPASDLANVRADPGQVDQILMNLAINAKDAMPSGGKLTIETANVELDREYADQHVGVAPGHYVMLAVSDTGHGMNAATKEHLFEPFFTTKERGKGTGLGLATVHGIVKQHGGHIWVYSEPGQGAVFKIYLPAVQEAVDANAPEIEAESPRGTETLLLVEDEPTVRSIVQRGLSACGYTILAATDGAEAERLLAKGRRQVALLLTDVVLTDINGRALYEKLKAREPKLKVLYMSGYTDNAVVHQGALEPDAAFVQKPFTLAAVARKVREALDR